MKNKNTMKKLLLLFVLIFSFAFSCSNDDEVTTQQTTGNCVKTYYLYHPAMGNGASYIPAWYEEIDSEICDCQETNGYVQVNNSQYSHYKVICD